MLKTTGIFKLTLRENLRGQILWSSAVAGLVLLLIMGILSGAAISHENRIIDVFSYFVSDVLLLMVALFSGAGICSSDFSARGVAELYIPSGISRTQLLLTRLAGHAIILFLLAIVLYVFKSAVIPFMTDSPKPPNLKIHFFMFIFSWLKAMAALSIAVLLGSLARPLYAILGTLTLFSFGHLTSTFDALLGSTTFDQSEAQISALNRILYGIFKVWNPNLLLVESIQGEWMMPSSNDVVSGVLWAAGFVTLGVGLTAWRINRMDIRA
jgi:hypothetical protein